MKQIRRRSVPFLYTVPFLVFMFALIVEASFMLATKGFEGVFSATLFNTPKGILLLVAAPLGLLAFLGFFLFGLVSDTLHHGGPSRLRSRVFLLSCIVLFFASFPQTVIVSRFVGAALDTWFSGAVSESLLSAEDLASLYTAERLRIIERISDRFLSGLSISNYRSRSGDWMNDIRSLDPLAAACQVYMLGGSDSLPEYRAVLETGDSSRFLPRPLLSRIRNGLFSLDGEEDTYRWGQIVRYGGEVYVCVYTSLLPEGFNDRLLRIRETYARARIIDTLKPYLPLMGIWIYAMFALPSILMVIIIAYYLSARLAEPVRSISEAAARLAEGDHSYRVIPHGADELAETALMLNAVADAAAARKRADKKTVLRL